MCTDNYMLQTTEQQADEENRDKEAEEGRGKRKGRGGMDKFRMTLAFRPANNDY